MRWRDFSWGQIFSIAVGLLQWTIAVAAVLGTLALFGWIIKLVVRKDKRNELN